jgi:hypothetical protein
MVHVCNPTREPEAGRSHHYRIRRAIGELSAMVNRYSLCFQVLWGRCVKIPRQRQVGFNFKAMLVHEQVLSQPGLHT